MHHVFYSNGNAKEISWVIQTDNSRVKQSREHVDIYKDKITNIQSKYIALHVGLFWGIGVFIIKNKDSIKVTLDEKIMYDQLTYDVKIDDDFIRKKVEFIRQLIEQRELKVQFESIDSGENLAKKRSTLND